MIERGTLLPKYARAVPEGVTRTPPTDPGTDSCGSNAPSVNMNQHSEIRLETETGQQLLTYSKRECSANWRSSVYEDDRDASDAIALSAATAMLGLLPNTKEGNHINLPRSFSASLRPKVLEEYLAESFLQFKHPLFSAHDRDGAIPDLDQLHHHPSSEIWNSGSVNTQQFEQASHGEVCALSARLDSQRREVVEERGDRHLQAFPGDVDDAPRDRIVTHGLHRHDQHRVSGFNFKTFVPVARKYCLIHPRKKSSIIRTSLRCTTAKRYARI